MKPNEVNQNTLKELLDRGQVKIDNNGKLQITKESGMIKEEIKGL